MSLQPSDDEDNRALLEQLRIALLDGYISILHGIQPNFDDMNYQPNQAQTAEITEFSLQMFQYLEAMVTNTALTFPPELLKTMFELYIDLVSIHVSDQDTNKNAPAGGVDLRQMIINSNLSNDIANGLGGLDAEDGADIKERFQIVQ